MHALSHARQASQYAQPGEIEHETHRGRLCGAGSADGGGPAQTGNIQLIVGFAAGGSADSIARIIGARLQEKSGRNVVVENRPGAGANIATKAVVQAAPDGTMLLVTTAALPINETLYRNKGFQGRC